MIDLTPMDYVRGTLFNALESGLTLDDVCRMSANADSPEAFDCAVNMLAQLSPQTTARIEIDPFQSTYRNPPSVKRPDPPIGHRPKNGAPHA